MEALHDTVRAGKVRYLGASSMWTWQFAKMQHAAELNGWTKFVSMQDHYNLLNREEEREMHPFCEDQGVGVIPWSPLARGRLARAYGEQTVRSEGDPFGNTLYQEASDERIIDAVGQLAEARGASRAQIALAWVLAKPAVTAPIVGATKISHLTDAVAALEISLSDEEITLLEQHYTPRTISGAFS
jgi:aryl-alcohol dehydrogenase-like predicted oxidoreductase